MSARNGMQRDGALGTVIRLTNRRERPATPIAAAARIGINQLDHAGVQIATT